MAIDPSRGLTVGVLGTGRMARLHIIGLHDLRQAGLEIGDTRYPVTIALYGRDPAKVAALAAEFGIEHTSTDLYGFVRDPALDLVDNCLVNSLHYEPLLAAIRAGKHVFSDKPLTIAVSEAERLLAEAERAGVAHGIVQNMRFQGGPTVARELLAAGELGRIFHARVTWGYMVPKRVTNRPTWFFKQELAGGGIVHDMMGHFFDLLRHLLEPSCGPIASVYCATGRGFDEREEPDGTPFPVAVEDTCSVVLRFRSGAIGDVFASWIRRKHEEVPFVEIDGEAGSVAFSFNDLRFQSQERTPSFTYDPTRVQAAFGEGWEQIEVHRQDPFALQLGRFLRGIVTGETVKPDWHDAVLNQRLIEAAYHSAAERREIAV